MKTDDNEGRIRALAATMAFSVQRLGLDPKNEFHAAFIAAAERMKELLAVQQSPAREQKEFNNPALGAGEPWAWALVRPDNTVVVTFEDGTHAAEVADRCKVLKLVPLYPPSPAREALERLVEAVEIVSHVAMKAGDGGPDSVKWTWVYNSLRAALASAWETLGKEKT